MPNGGQPTLWPDLPPNPDVIAAILRLPISGLDGRETPARVAHIERAAVEGLVPEFLAVHLTRSGHVDDETWSLLSVFWGEGTESSEDEW